MITRVESDGNEIIIIIIIIIIMIIIIIIIIIMTMILIISHIVSACPLPQKEYKKRHDNVARAIHWDL